MTDNAPTEQKKGDDFKARRYRSDIFFQVKRQLSSLPTAEEIEANMNSLVEAITQDLDDGGEKEEE